jgi:hypothetical protein
MKKKCDGNCCDAFFEDYDESDDDYEIQRLEDIIEICKFLIKVRKHRKQKKEVFNKILEEEKEEEPTRLYTNVTYPFYLYRYPKRNHSNRVSDWDRIWF